MPSTAHDNPLSPFRLTRAIGTALSLLAACSPAAAQTWLPLGPSPTIMIKPDSPSTNVVGMGNNPVSGAMRAILPLPNDSNVMFAGAVNGGIWKSSDRGVHWEALGDELPSLSIGAMTFDRSDPSRLWVGFGKQSSYKVGGAQTGIVMFDTSTGKWESPASTQLMGKDISRIVANGQNIMVDVKTSPSEIGVWHSTDGGATFTNSANGLPNGNVTSLVGNPNDDQQYYAAVMAAGAQTGVYRTNDGGANWTMLPDVKINNGAVAGELSTQDMMLSIAANGTVVASVIDAKKTATGLIAENPNVTVYRSSDGGDSWQKMGTPSTFEHLPDGTTVNWGVYSSGQFSLHGALLVDPNDPNVVYISGDTQGPFPLIEAGIPTSIGATTYSGRLFRGVYDPISGSTTWEAITNNFTANGSGPHADSRFMLIDADGNLLQSDDGGVYLRTDLKTANGIWYSLNGNLQTGEVHDAQWNSLSHTVVTAMQDNGATVQLAAGNPTHTTASSGDGGIAAVNPNWRIDGQRYAAVYVSSQHLNGTKRIRLAPDNDSVSATPLQIGIERDGQFVPFGESTGADDPPRPKKPVTKGQALAAQAGVNVESVPFYPVFALNSVDPSRLAVGGYDLYIGQDSMIEAKEGIQITTTNVLTTGPDNTGFISLAYGARNNADALLAGSGYADDISVNGKLYYTSDVYGAAPEVIYGESGGTGIQAALFDRALGTDRIYFSDGATIERGVADGGHYDFTDMGESLPESFNEKRGLDHILNNGVSALVTAGTHNVAGGNWLYTLRNPAYATTFNWDTRLGKLPNSQIFGLDYSVEDDVLLSYTMGRGAFALTDVTTYFPEATRLVFGQADNNSQPINAQLTDGEDLSGKPFSRPLVKNGNGVLNLAGTVATYSGGTQLNGGTTLADADVNLGARGTGVSFDGGRLNLLDGFALDESGKFIRPLTVYSGGGIFDTAQNDIPFAGTINGNGTLSFLGRPLRMAGDIHLNAVWNAPMDIPAGNTLRGTGRINGALAVSGTLYPGNSPGTFTVSGPVVQMPGSAFAVDIDGPGTGNGAGNYSRLLVVGSGNSYTAGGEFKPYLRNISGAANNDYTPSLGQGFTVVEADGGVWGSYTGLAQPSAGLPTGTRLDTVYRDQAVQLYVTPASYNRLDAVGVSANSNQRLVGAALENVRPAAGLRAPDTGKALLDAFAPVSAPDMRNALDQASGVSHAQLLWADLNNNKFLGNQLMTQIGARRRGEANSAMQSSVRDGEGYSWARVLRANHRMDNDDVGYGYSGTLTGVIAGFERRVSTDTVAGLALGYVDDTSDVNDDLGRGRLQDWQIMAYGARERNGWFMQGSVGLGMGQIAAKRDLRLPGLNDTYRADLRTRNVSLSGQAGWYLGERDGMRLETWAGLHYLYSRHLHAAEQGSAQAAELDISAGALQSLSAAIGVNGSVPFSAGGMDWRAALNGKLSQELLDKRPSMTATLMGTTMDISGAAAGRTTITTGLGVAAQINQRVSFQADISREAASGWGQTIATMGLKVMW